MAAFRRTKNPALVPVGPTASQFPVPDGMVSLDVNAFQVMNSNNCYVRLMGSRGTFAPVAEGLGWLFPPGFTAVYGTQRPNFMSALAVDRPGFPIAGLTFVPLEVSYGVGE